MKEGSSLSGQPLGTHYKAPHCAAGSDKAPG